MSISNWTDHFWPKKKVVQLDKNQLNPKLLGFPIWTWASNSFQNPRVFNIWGKSHLSLSSRLSADLSLSAFGFSKSLSRLSPGVDVSPSLRLSVSPSLHLSVSPSLRFPDSPSRLLSDSPSRLLSDSPSRLLSDSPSRFLSDSPSVSSLSLALSQVWSLQICLFACLFWWVCWLMFMFAC